MSNDYFVCQYCEKINPTRNQSSFCVNVLPELRFCDECFANEMDGKCAYKNRIWVPTKDFFADRTREGLKKIREITAELEICASEMLDDKICTSNIIAVKVSSDLAVSSTTGLQRFECFVEETDSESEDRFVGGVSDIVDHTTRPENGVDQVRLACARAPVDIPVDTPVAFRHFENATPHLPLPRWVLKIKERERNAVLERNASSS